MIIRQRSEVVLDAGFGRSLENVDYAVRVSETEGLDQYRVDRAEDGGVGANTESKRQKSD